MDGKIAYAKIKKFLASFSPLVKSWDSAICLFTPKRIDSTLDDALKLADTRLALKIFVIASLITTVLSLLALAESVQIENFTYETAAEIYGEVQQTISMGDIYPLIAYHILTGIVLALFINIGIEVLAYNIAKITGGKGSFSEHLYLISIVTMSIAMLNVLAFLMAIPWICVQLSVWAVWMIVGNIYLLGYIGTKTYSTVHKITFTHGLAIMVLVSIIRFAIMVAVMNWLGDVLSLSEILGA